MDSLRSTVQPFFSCAGPPSQATQESSPVVPFPQLPQQQAIASPGLVFGPNGWASIPQTVEAHNQASIARSVGPDYLPPAVPPPPPPSGSSRPSIDLGKLFISRSFSTPTYEGAGREYGTHGVYTAHQLYPEYHSLPWPAGPLSPATASDFDISRIQLDHQERMAPLDAPYPLFNDMATGRWPYSADPLSNWNQNFHAPSPNIISLSSSPITGYTPAPSNAASSAPQSQPSATSSFNGALMSPGASQTPANDAADSLLSVGACPDDPPKPHPYSAGHAAARSDRASSEDEDERSKLDDEYEPKANNSRRRRRACSKKKVGGDEYVADWSSYGDDAPYAIHIYRALMSVPGHRMDLAELYAWLSANIPRFRKAKGKGWRNSVRYNLSRNRDFLHVERQPNDPGKGGIWVLSEHARKVGIKSTARYRNAGGSNARRKVYEERLPSTSRQLRKKDTKSAMKKSRSPSASPSSPSRRSSSAQSTVPTIKASPSAVSGSPTPASSIPPEQHSSSRAQSDEPRIKCSNSQSPERNQPALSTSVAEQYLSQQPPTAVDVKAQSPSEPHTEHYDVYPSYTLFTTADALHEDGEPDNWDIDDSSQRYENYYPKFREEMDLIRSCHKSCQSLQY